MASLRSFRVGEAGGKFFKVSESLWGAVLLCLPVLGINTGDIGIA